MKLTDEQKLDLFKRAIPYLRYGRSGYCLAFEKSLIDIGIYKEGTDLDPYEDSFKLNNMRPFQRFFKKHILQTYLLPYGDKYLQHRINVLKYLINQLEIKLYGEVQTDYSEK